MKRHDRLIRERVHDPYKLREKPRDATVCPECGVVFRAGHWQWSPHRVEASEKHLCPACRRIADDCPAGVLTLEGPFVGRHRTEILGLLHNEAKSELSEHPLNRVMAVADDGMRMTVMTTEMHLAERLGKAVHAAYAGELDARHVPGESMIRVHWQR